MADDIIKNVRAASPFPWRQVIYPSGIVQIVDAGNKEVPLFTLTEFSVFITNVMFNQKEKVDEAA